MSPVGPPMGDRPRLVFVLSLPRSGSTLVQRLLAAHPAVATAAEPWLLLPLVYALRDHGIYTEYHQETAIRGIGDLLALMPDGIGNYRVQVRKLITALYGQVEPGARVFIDKTPRYHLIASDLLDFFPGARLVVLWRNPLAVAASIMRTWQDGRWNLHRWQVDLYKGVENLDLVVRADPDRVLAVRYEDLLTDPVPTAKKLFGHIGEAFDPRYLGEFQNVELDGRLGDKTGSVRYRELSEEPLGAWMNEFRNPLRRRWARKYLAWIGEDRLERMGYDMAGLLKELRGRPGGARHLLSDACYRLSALGFYFLEPQIIRHKLEVLGRPEARQTHK
jgi:hypothetical protein